MNSDRRSFLSLLFRGGREVVQTVVHEGMAGTTDRVEVLAERMAEATTAAPAALPEAVAAEPGITVRPVVWPGLAARGFAESLAPGEFDWADQADMGDLSAQVAAGHLALLPLNTGMLLTQRGMELYLLGTVGPEPAALVSAGDSVSSWLDLMWHWAAVAAEQPILYPLTYRLSGGDANRLTGCFGVLPEAEILSMLHSGRLRAAVLSGTALQRAMAYSGLRVAVDISAAVRAKLPGAPWAPLTGLFATREALTEAAAVVAGVVDGYVAALGAGDEPLEYAPADVCQPWVEALLEQELLRRPSASPAEERWGE